MSALLLMLLAQWNPNIIPTRSTAVTGIDGGAVPVSGFPASQPVTGTFFQATQPVSLASMPSTPVTGAFYQATQPVSGTLTCNAGSGTLAVSLASAPTTAVTGTFFQATQPVSGRVTAEIYSVNDGGVQAVSLASVPTHGVTGTFWQATQPISGAVTVASTTITGNVAVTHAAGSISGSNPCANPTATILGLQGATSGTASVQLIALSGTTKIYLCSLNVTGVSGTTPTIKLTYGTGTACATAPVTVVGPVNPAANVSIYYGPTVAVTAGGAELCYLQTGTAPIFNYNLTYVQQ